MSNWKAHHTYRMTFRGLTPDDDRKEKLCFKCEDVKCMCGHLLATEKKGDVQRSPYFREVGEVRGSERINGGWIFLSPHICIRNPKDDPRCYFCQTLWNLRPIQ